MIFYSNLSFGESIWEVSKISLAALTLASIHYSHWVVYLAASFANVGNDLRI